jgi:hypothetical protein
MIDAPNSLVVDEPGPQSQFTPAQPEPNPLVVGEPEPLVATPHTVTSASVGTALATGAGTISAFTFTQPTSASIDDSTPLTLVDAAAAPTGISSPPHVLYSANLKSLTYLNDPKPGLALTPGLTAPTWPKSLGIIAIPFTNGCFVQSCPANTTFTVSI